jgi:hypothetical protein
VTIIVCKLKEVSLAGEFLSKAYIVTVLTEEMFQFQLPPSAF